MPKHLFTIPHGTVLPDPAGLPEGYPFRLDPINELHCIVGGAWVTLIGAGGGGAGAFSDSFDRADVFLDGNNGWFTPDPPTTAQLKIVSSQVVVPAGASPEWGNTPILHARDDSNPGVADVTLTVGRTSTAGFTLMYVASDNVFGWALGIDFDGSAGSCNLEIIESGAGGPSTWDTNPTAGTWPAFTGSTAEIRLVYTQSTRTFQVYRDGVLAAQLNDVQAALDTYYGAGTFTFPDISALQNAGWGSNTGAGIETFDNFVCA